MTLKPVPVTESETVAGVLATAPVIAKLAAEVTVALRAKLMLRVTFWPPETGAGTPGEGTEGEVKKTWAWRNWLVGEAAVATVTAVLALFVAVAVKLLVEPTCTTPKLTALFGVVAGAALIP